ncbi:hypothetical protein [Pedobacter zeae]|uniref:DUF5681 domain-containing protein n=1 Tax=Pedobacter zeae TaxID=1737356 RepID=A0A7W6P608_9SPHI|nr:hypothetical protein [Pedobacter zeae]MBB4108338.1 hypothetical protein [Pedobacter zeae]GGG93447.1 hypothetical protein GCM10007422_03350 [Pedobacter zeae]
MPFVKGVSGCPTGRPKGKRKKPVKPILEKLLEKTLPVIEQEISTCDPETRRSFFKDLTKVVLTLNV